MNYVNYGRQRDEQIINLVSNGTAFTRLQIQKIIFEPHMSKESAKRKCQDRLSDLYKMERIKKHHKDLYLPAIYYVDQKPINLAHYLEINDVYCAFLEQKPSDVTLDWEWKYRICDGLVIADSCITIYWNKEKKNKQVIWLEIERNPLKRFNKPDQYKKVWETDWNKTLPEWCVTDFKSKLVVFPTILIVTDKKLEINSDLRFVIATREQVQNDIYSLIRRNKDG